jgi:hypothetical protein
VPFGAAPTLNPVPLLSRAPIWRNLERLIPKYLAPLISGLSSSQFRAGNYLTYSILYLVPYEIYGAHNVPAAKDIHNIRICLIKVTLLFISYIPVPQFCISYIIVLQNFKSCAAVPQFYTPTYPTLRFNKNNTKIVPYEFWHQFCVCVPVPLHVQIPTLQLYRILYISHSTDTPTVPATPCRTISRTIPYLIYSTLCPVPFRYGGPSTNSITPNSRPYSLTLPNPNTRQPIAALRHALGQSTPSSVTHE